MDLNLTNFQLGGGGTKGGSIHTIADWKKIEKNKKKKMQLRVKYHMTHSCKKEKKKKKRHMMSHANKISKLEGLNKSLHGCFI